MAGVAKLFDGHIRNKSQEEIDLYDEQHKGKVFGLYFSAHWCPPCRAFTPALVDFYNRYHAEKNFEVILISWDRDEDSFNDYYKDMPWLTLDFSERTKNDQLAERFRVKVIPKLVLLDGDSGEIVCEDARSRIQLKDTKGKHFPWNSMNHRKKKSDKCILL